MSVEPTKTEFDHEEWGDGRVVSNWGNEPGKWVMYDPDGIVEDVEDWR